MAMEQPEMAMIIRNGQLGIIKRSEMLQTNLTIDSSNFIW
jgi:hypothetical protein